jgi:hypothetical protein
MEVGMTRLQRVTLKGMIVLIIPLVFCILIPLAKEQAIRYAQGTWWIVLGAAFFALFAGAIIHIFYTKPIRIPAPEEPVLYQLYLFLFLPSWIATYIYWMPFHGPVQGLIETWPFGVVCLTVILCTAVILYKRKLPLSYMIPFSNRAERNILDEREHHVVNIAFVTAIKICVFVGLVILLSLAGFWRHNVLDAISITYVLSLLLGGSVVFGYSFALSVFWQEWRISS